MEDLNYLKVINTEVIRNPIEYVNKCERGYCNQLRRIVDDVIARPGDVKIIMLSGPSSSGKTTGANKMARMFSQLGHDANVISLDDFYINRSEIPVDKDGQQDFEAVYALDIVLIQNTLKDLLKTGKTKLPYFDFNTGIRTDNVFNLEVEPGEIVIIEGLHAINPIFTDEIDTDNIFKVYVSTASSIYDDDKTVLFDKRDVRFIRRMIRDYQFRSAPVEKTYTMWPKVIEGEDKYLVPLIDRADYVIDSLHPYELCIYKDIAEELLGAVLEDSEYYDDSKVLLEKMKRVTRLGKDIIPKDSLLREFVG